jgi:hypothetical protein
MKTDKQGFSDAFYKLVKPREYLDHNNVLYPYANENDYSGSIHTEVFSIHKMTRDNNFERVDGKIIEKPNGVLLELCLCLEDDWLMTGFCTFVISVLICYGIGGIPFIYDLISDYFLIAIIIMVVPVFAILFWLSRYVTAMRAYGLKDEFIDVLNEIEKQVEPSKQHSTQ